MRTNLIAGLVSALVGIIGLAGHATAAELHVSPRGPEHYRSISEAVQEAEDGDTVVVHPGVYDEGLALKDRNLTITSTNPWDLDIIKTTIVRAVWLPDRPYSCTIRGLTVRGGGVHGTIEPFGYDYDPGNSASYVENCIVQDHVIEGYSDVLGGGIIGVGGAVRQSLVWHNHVISKVKINDGYPATSWARGGGIVQSYQVEGCVVLYNSASGADASEGGGLLGCRNVMNSIFMGNSETRFGYMPNFGIWSSDLINCTIINERTGLAEDTNTRYTNSIIIDAIDNRLPEAIYSLTDTPVDGEGNITTAPVFLSGYRLAPGSPGVDGGDPDPAYNDAHRPPAQGTERNDMGAYGGPGAAPMLFGGDNWPLLDDDGDGVPNICEPKSGSCP